ncbi:DUF4328 domain-containing protein [Nocardia brasiliensis]|uniref:DUF4328 domain-containing protein n=1 Tax=Nocardia brasiliensis TaxID=37326 RepID=UPI0009DCCE46|nr:DUF4328 domain-containing protein [Nocardia brasiliensis]
MSVGWDAALARGGRNVRPIGALAAWAIGLVAAAVVMMFVSAIADWRLLADFEKSWGQPGVTRTEWQSYTGVGVLAHLLQFSAGIVVISWLWRARHNAEALCTARHRLANGWVIGGWFCPVVNLWFPHTIMSDVWRASDPRTPPDAPDLRGRPGSALVTAWWLFLLLGWVLGFVALVLGIPSSRTFAPTFDLYCFPSGRDMSQYGGDTLIERFQRSAATVTIRRQEYGFQDPKIVVSFENSPRNSCHIYSEAPPDRESEHVEWWRSAPL